MPVFGAGLAAPSKTPACWPGYCYPASAVDETAVAQVQTDLRRCILRAFVGRGLLESQVIRRPEHDPYQTDFSGASYHGNP